MCICRCRRQFAVINDLAHLPLLFRNTHPSSALPIVNYRLIRVHCAMHAITTIPTNEIKIKQKQKKNKTNFRCQFGNFRCCMHIHCSTALSVPPTMPHSAMPSSSFSGLTFVSTLTVLPPCYVTSLQRFSISLSPCHFTLCLCCFG